MTKKEMIATARQLAAEIGAINITKEALCQRAGIPRGSFRSVMGEVSFSDLIESLANTEAYNVTEVTRTRAHPALRKQQILATAIALSCEIGYQNITREQVAERAAVSQTLVSSYFGSMDLLRCEIMEAAIIKDIPQLIAQGLAVGDEIAGRASDALKRRAGAYIQKS